MILKYREKLQVKTYNSLLTQLFLNLVNKVSTLGGPWWSTVLGHYPMAQELRSSNPALGISFLASFVLQIVKCWRPGCLPVTSCNNQTGRQADQANWLDYLHPLE